MGILSGYYGNLGWLNHTRGKIEKAERYYRKAIAQGAETANVYAGLTGIYVQRGDYEGAYNIITEGISKARVSKKNKIAIKSLSSQYVVTLWKLGRLEEAICEMETVHAEMPSANSYGTLGYFYIERGDKTGDYSQALEFNIKAAEYLDDDATILDNLAQVYFRLGEYDKAEEYFRKALAERPAQVDSLYYLTKVCVIKGNFDEAREHLAKALSLGVSNTSTITPEMLDSLKAELDG